ncbi:MerR family transcriptional regulator [Paenibacillus sacheonensis]|uniref:MerR family transcriptional regulator n=1 Tax=Paenibacillus sacheonensis TaxID=742054 RepID=A0A7X4YUZ3_9BACL|nr:MerR family transcriptional regulator [Paenibacillus sacheonensis]MBM7568397.1 chromosome-anchoring protein RacA [Paenibacillus sacheonensis]NBC72096.1 MerR family transcriptional regulator [Paenibacillus sacheonensis]
MEAVKSKDAALSLNVSQTTIKRWASYYPNVFRKDRFGHYMFNGRDLELLGLIKAAIERGETMEQIKLPVPGMEQPRLDEAFLETAASSELLRTADNDMLTRILQLEQRLEQKADEVVNAQIRQHRQELEEMRRMIEQLSASMEHARQPLPAVADQPRKNEAASPAPAASSRRRGLFKSMFMWF